MKLTVSSTAKGGISIKNYQYFTDEQKQIAHETDLATLLRLQGESLSKVGSEYEWNYGCEKISIRKNLWYNQYTQEGGDAIDFLQVYFNMDYAEAMSFLLGGCNGMILGKTTKRVEEKKPLVLPKPHDNYRRVFAYLMHQRGIDRDVIYTFIHRKMIYESTKHHNVLFVGYDKHGIPRHAHKRSTGKDSKYKGNVLNSAPEYSFHWCGEGGKIYLFEAPIDMLSYITMHKKHWQKHSYAAACSVSDRVLFQMIEDYPHLKEVFLCFDNDEAGQKASQRISDKLFLKGIKSEILVPHAKDWNEDLLEQIKGKESEMEK